MLDAANPVVQKWEQHMSRFKQTLPWAKKNEKWVLMEHYLVFENQLCRR